MKNLEDLGFIINTNVKSKLIDQTNQVRDRAKAILESESSSRTGKKYWTGKLQNAIKTDIMTDDSTVTGTRVGVDLRSARYAEWVEIGHKVISGYRRETIGGPKVAIGSGAWWEGYHYLESAYLEIAPYLSSKITDTVKEAFTHFSFKGGRTRNVKTGQFSKGQSYLVN